MALVPFRLATVSVTAGYRFPVDTSWCDSFFFGCRAGAEKNILVRFRLGRPRLRPHPADKPAVPVDAHHDPLDILSFEKTAGMDHDFTFQGWIGAGISCLIGRSNLPADHLGIQTESRQADGIQMHVT